ncbi:hypothetical protein TSUD_97980 [Trifolium subterraneum]|uniref:Reverse transcriptase domain-containing protein n=1 Tax=Trifolium subterraneum TaxID=3900 RepID=A0A2Z6NY43_TRISU|nr:hypothetical protein TSUD_97980 [Trifolium subterraneum]
MFLLYSLKYKSILQDQLELPRLYVAKIGDKWRAWMKTCVCTGKLSVLVNGSPTEEVNINRGLKQGDPLAPFLFLLVAEGLSALSHRVVSLDFFKGFQVSSEVSVFLLQYADDTLFIGEACVENLWSMKAILRWFELASGLKINFSKSRLIGVNVDNNFLQGSAFFLHCKIGVLPFIYLGLPVGANSRLASTWDPVIKTIEKRLLSWKHRYVRNDIVQLQRKFLWGGASGDKGKIPYLVAEEISYGERSTVRG